MTELQKHPQLAQILRQLRVTNNYLQDDIAAVINVTRSAYANYEAGVRQPDPAQLMRLADFYHVSFSDLLTQIYLPDSDVCRRAVLPSPEERLAEELRQRMANPRVLWNELFSPEHTRLVFYYTKVDPLGQREISEFIQRTAEGIR